MKNYRIPLIIGVSVLIAGVATWAVLAARGNSTNDMNGMAGMDHSAASASDHNDADVTFAQMMVPHHMQAIDMSDMLLAKTGVDARVVSLATEIKSSQQPEIDAMNGWLKTWGKTSESGQAMNMSMSDTDMKALENADGATASKLFLQQMVEHHKSAIDMAQTEVKDGKSASATAMARSIVVSQSEEVTSMQTLAQQL